MHHAHTHFMICIV